jgi:putative transposase
LESMVQTGRTYTSTDNPIAERIFGTMQFGVLNTQGGYVGSRPGELPGYDPAANTRLTPDSLYGIITRYLVNEYSHQPHRGVGMFGMTPWQKLEETRAKYGDIEAPSPEKRRLYLGITRVMSTTSEGVLFDFLPYNSNALQHFHDGKPKKVKIYLDPDFKDKVTIQPLRSKLTFEADLKMTAFEGLTYEETIAVAKAAAQDNPAKSKINDAMVKEARAKRVTESGFYLDPNKPEAYSKVALLEMQATALKSIDFVPDRSFAAAPVLMPGSITQRPQKSSGQKPPPSPATFPSGGGAPPNGPNFTPIKKSKL